MDRIVSSSDSYVEVLIPSVTVLGKRAFKEVIKRGHKGALIPQDWCPYRRKRPQEHAHTEERPREDTARRWPSIT